MGLEPVVSLEEWCAQHNLKPLSRPCKNCGIELTTTIPVATRMCRGLKSEPHACGEQYTLFMLKPIDKEFLELINNVKESL